MFSYTNTIKTYDIYIYIIILTNGKYILIFQHILWADSLLLQEKY